MAYRLVSCPPQYSRSERHVLIITDYECHSQTVGLLVGSRLIFSTPAPYCVFAQVYYTAFDNKCRRLKAPVFFERLGADTCSHQGPRFFLMFLLWPHLCTCLSLNFHTDPLIDPPPLSTLRSYSYCKVWLCVPCPFNSFDRHHSHLNFIITNFVVKVDGRHGNIPNARRTAQHAVHKRRVVAGSLL